MTVENRPFQLSNQSHTAFRASATTPEPCTPNPHPKSKLCVGARPHAPPPPIPNQPPTPPEGAGAAERRNDQNRARLGREARPALRRRGGAEPPPPPPPPTLRCSSCESLGVGRRRSEPCSGLCSSRGSRGRARPIRAAPASPAPRPARPMQRATARRRVWCRGGGKPRSGSALTPSRSLPLAVRLRWLNGPAALAPAAGPNRPCAGGWPQQALRPGRQPEPCASASPGILASSQALPGLRHG